VEQVTDKGHAWPSFNFHSFVANEKVLGWDAVSLSEWVPMAGRKVVLSLSRLSNRRSFEVLENTCPKT